MWQVNNRYSVIWAVSSVIFSTRSSSSSASSSVAAPAQDFQPGLGEAETGADRAGCEQCRVERHEVRGIFVVAAAKLPDRTTQTRRAVR